MKESLASIGANRIGPDALVAPDVIVGHPSKAGLLEERDFARSQGATVGSRAILRSGTVIYERAIVGNDVQTAHHVIVREDARVGDGCVLGNGTVIREQAVLGRNVRLMESVVISEGAIVGDNVFIGPHVTFTAGRQMTGALEAAGKMSRAEAADAEGQAWLGASVIVEDEARIGANAVILAGVRLGRGCVVAAGSVVSTNVPAGATVAGNPARMLRQAAPVAPALVAAAPVVPATVAPTVGEPAAAPAGDMRIHHVGIAVKSICEALPGYERLFGCRMVKPPVTDPTQKVTVCFLASGDPNGALIELVEPAGEDSPINATLRKGGGLYHVCHEVADVSATLERMRAAGCILVSGPTPAPAFDGRPIAWLYTPARQLIELVQR